MEISEEEYKEFLRLKNLKWALDLLQTEQGKKEYASQVLQVENEELKAEVEILRDVSRRVLNVGHNNDCLFCGFKDRAALEALHNEKEKQ